jgi:hypothetical protein
VEDMPSPGLELIPLDVTAHSQKMLGIYKMSMFTKVRSKVHILLKYAYFILDYVRQ